MLMPERFRDTHQSAVAECLASERKNVPWAAIELPGLHRSGREIQLELSFSEFKEQGKKLFTGVARDISERKRAEAVLRESEERLRGLFENARDVVFTCDLQGNFTSLNAAGEQLTGYTRQEALESNFTRVVAPEYLELAKEMLARKAVGDVASIYELEIITKNGGRVLVEISSRTLHRDSQLIGVQGSARDITARKRDEEALRRSEEQYRILFDSNPQPMWVYDLDTLAFLAVNEAAIKHYGYSRTTFLSMTLDNLHAEADAARLIVCARNISGLAHCGEWRHCTSDGDTIDVEITANVIDFGNRRAGLVLVNDITQHKAAEKALRASEEQLQQSQKLEAIGQLAGGVAHDFNNLLTAIAGYSDLTLRLLTEEDPLRCNLIEIKKATERAASLTRQLLAFSRKQIMEPKILDLNAVVKDMSKMLSRLIGEDVELVTDLADEIGKVKADPGQVEQIIMNLVVNARDAMPHGGKVTIETQDVLLDETYVSRHMPVQPGEYTMLAISDTGMGMNRETQMHVFEPFFTTKSAGKGTGLGLSTVYGIVKQSGGYVWVYSELNNGTVFKVYLPRVQSGARDEKVKTSTTGALRGSETILLVEDEEIVRRMARMILESSGYSVLEAGDVKDALRLCYENVSKIDLMLTDVIMPGMSGRVLAERVAVLCPELPVIFMSGYTDDAIVRHGILEEDIVFLQKPFTRDSLLTKVREAMNHPLLSA
jgi:PAS domain S-box-containing protein